MCTTFLPTNTADLTLFLLLLPFKLLALVPRHASMNVMAVASAVLVSATVLYDLLGEKQLVLFMGSLQLPSTL